VSSSLAGENPQVFGNTAARNCLAFAGNFFALGQNGYQWQAAEVRKAGMPGRNFRIGHNPPETEMQAEVGA
jgi:hypothetical protein